MRFEIILGRGVAVFFKGRGDEIFLIGEDTRTAVLRIGAHPARAFTLHVLLSVRVLAEEQDLFAFTGGYQDSGVWGKILFT